MHPQSSCWFAQSFRIQNLFIPTTTSWMLITHAPSPLHSGASGQTPANNECQRLDQSSRFMIRCMGLFPYMPLLQSPDAGFCTSTLINRFGTCWFGILVRGCCFSGGFSDQIPNSWAPQALRQTFSDSTKLENDNLNTTTQITRFITSYHMPFTSKYKYLMNDVHLYS